MTRAEIRYLYFLANPNRPKSCMRPNRKSLKRLTELGYIKVVAQSRMIPWPNGADFGITELGRIAIMPRVSSFIREFNR